MKKDFYIIKILFILFQNNNNKCHRKKSYNNFNIDSYRMLNIYEALGENG